MPIRAPEFDTAIHGTTILCVRNAGHVVVAGDGQVSVGQTIMKHGARKVRRLHDDKVLSGFAGSTPSRARQSPAANTLRFLSGRRTDATSPSSPTEN